MTHSERSGKLEKLTLPCMSCKECANRAENRGWRNLCVDRELDSFATVSPVHGHRVISYSEFKEYKIIKYSKA